MLQSDAHLVVLVAYARLFDSRPFRGKFPSNTFSDHVDSLSLLVPLLWHKSVIHSRPDWG